MRYDRDGLTNLLREAREAAATDIHIKAPSAPRFRIDGNLVPSPHPALRPDDTRRLAQALLDLAGREVPLATLTDMQIGFGVRQEGRFRAHIYRQRGSLGIMIHRMALAPPGLADLGGAPGLGEAIWGRRGLVLVTGHRDRLEVLAAAADWYNHGRAGSLFMIEEPLEFLHKDARAAISQREVGVDVPSVADGLTCALRTDCDAVIVTDIPDAPSAQTLLRLAEEGRTVVAGLAGADARTAASTLAHLFPPDRWDEAGNRVRRCLHGVLCRVEGNVVLLPPGTD